MVLGEIFAGFGVQTVNKKVHKVSLYVVKIKQINLFVLFSIKKTNENK